jgi:hypothetical protein
MAVPEYDEDLARAVDDWADVPGAPDALSDVPTRCIFCGEFIPITDTDPAEPVLVISKPWTNRGGWLHASHVACLRAAAERTRTA